MKTSFGRKIRGGDFFGRKKKEAKTFFEGKKE